MPAYHNGVDTDRELFSRYISRTRLVPAPSLGDQVYVKLESEQPTGSFKVRGALHALQKALDALPDPRPPRFEVVASSTGNHGAAVAWAAARLGVRATIFLPRHPNPVKRANIVRQGADVVEHGRDLSEAFQAATDHVNRTGAFFLDDATYPEVPEGAATISDEIVDQLPDVAAIYVPVGDTALIRGVAARAKQLKPSIRIVGVQAEKAPAYYLSWRDGRVVTTNDADTIADGLATRSPVEANVNAIRTLVDEMRLVSEQAMLDGVRRLLLDEHLVAEPSAASTVAAFSSAPSTGPAVLLITGCNIPPDILRRAITFGDLVGW